MHASPDGRPGTGLRWRRASSTAALSGLRAWVFRGRQGGATVELPRLPRGETALWQGSPVLRTGPNMAVVSDPGSAQGEPRRQRVAAYAVVLRGDGDERAVLL